VLAASVLSTSCIAQAALGELSKSIEDSSGCQQIFLYVREIFVRHRPIAITGPLGGSCNDWPAFPSPLFPETAHSTKLSNIVQPAMPIVGQNPLAKTLSPVLPHRLFALEGLAFWDIKCPSNTIVSPYFLFLRDYA
jgi:hypothetical protein